MASESVHVGLSVVVPSLNQGRFIRDAIDSILKQCDERVEVIVVDGGSMDETLEVLRGYGDQIRFISEKDEGQSDALVKGFTMATMPWLSWLNSDDLLVEGALDHVFETMARLPGADVIVGNGHYVDENGAFLRTYPRIACGSSTETQRQLFERGYLPQPSVYFTRKAYDAVGGIDPTIHGPMDYDLWVRLAKAGYDFVPLEPDISASRWYPETKTSSGYLSLMKEVARIQLREYDEVSPYFVQAISDHLYSMFHAPLRGERWHLLHRSVYFKTVWIWLNYHKAGTLLRGLFRENIAKSGALVGDTLSFSDLRDALPRALRKLRRP